MSIIIRRAEAVCLPADNKKRRKRNNQSGFTLPEVLVSLCIVWMLLQGICQWGAVMQGTLERMGENDKAVYLAQEVLYGRVPECPDSWQIRVEEQRRSELLEETIVTIQSERRTWQFYYAGPNEQEVP